MMLELNMLLNIVQLSNRFQKKSTVKKKHIKKNLNKYDLENKYDLKFIQQRLTLKIIRISNKTTFLFLTILIYQCLHCVVFANFYKKTIIHFFPKKFKSQNPSEKKNKITLILPQALRE